MLKTIRNLNFGWILVLVGIVMIISGISMTEGKTGEQTFVCFDSGCIYIQGISNMVIGLLCLGIGIYKILKNGKNKTLERISF